MQCLNPCLQLFPPIMWSSARNVVFVYRGKELSTAWPCLPYSIKYHPSDIRSKEQRKGTVPKHITHQIPFLHLLLSLILIPTLLLSAQSMLGGPLTFQRGFWNQRSHLPPRAAAAAPCHSRRNCNIRVCLYYTVNDEVMENCQRMRHMSLQCNPALTVIPGDTAGKDLGRGENSFPINSWTQTVPVAQSLADSAFFCGYSEVILARKKPFAQKM